MSKEFSMDQMQALMGCIAKNHISEFLYESEGFRLRIRGEAPEQAAPMPAAAPAPVIAPAAVAQAPAAQAAVPVQEQEAVPASRCIEAPLVGTFYAAAGPDKDPFVKVGQHVSEGETVFIVESMKVMNEVPADKSGVVAEILVENGAPVEYGQPVIRLE